MAFPDRAAEISKKLYKSAKVRIGVGVAAAAAAGLTLYGTPQGQNFQTELQRAMSTPGFCSESNNLTPHTGPISEDHVYSPENSALIRGATVRSLSTLPDQRVLVGQSSPNSPDNDFPVNPVRVIDPTGVEVCNSLGEPVKGAVNSVIYNDSNKELVVVKDTKEDPNNTAVKPGQVVSSLITEKRWFLVGDRKRWVHYRYEANNPETIGDWRGYSAINNGWDTWVPTWEGVFVKSGTGLRQWRREDFENPERYRFNTHSLLVTGNPNNNRQSIVWFGGIDKGIRTYPSTPAIEAAASQAPKQIRDIQQNPYDARVYVAAADRSGNGFGYFDPDNNFEWKPIALPGGAKDLQSIVINPLTKQPCVGNFEGGVYCADRSGLYTPVRGTENSHVLSLTTARWEIQGTETQLLLAGTREGTIIQIAAPK